MTDVRTEVRSVPICKGNVQFLLNKLGALKAFDKRRQSNVANLPSFELVTSHMISEGSRNNELTSIAGRLRHLGASEGELKERLLAVNAAQCSPPLPKAEVLNIATSVGSYPVPPHRQLKQNTSAELAIDPYNDTANAIRYVKLFGDDLMYVARAEQWYVWDGNRWHEDGNSQRVEFAKQVGREILAEASLIPDKAPRRIHESFARRSGDTSRISAMIALAKSDPRLTVASSFLDTHDELLGVANGLLDLRTGKLIENTRDKMVTRHSTVVFDPQAKCPSFHRFLNRVMRSAQWPNDLSMRERKRRVKDLVRFLQRLVGYCLSGRTDEQKLFFLFGNGANGKTTLLKILEYLLGSELTRQLPYDSLMVQKQARNNTNDIARLRDVRVVFTNEVEDSTFLAESMIKQLTGGDAISARMLFKEFQEFIPKFKLFIAGNHKPVIKGDDEGIWRRMTLIPFQAKIPVEERDPRLLVKLRAELPGILNWALKGYRQWLNEGLNPPECVAKASIEYREEMDLMGQWLLECCRVGPTERCKSSLAYANYQLWAKCQGLRSLSNSAFGRKLAERFSRTRRSDGNYYSGFTVVKESSTSLINELLNGV